MAPLPPPSFAQRVAFQWKRGWNEIPEVMGAGCIAAASLVGLATVMYTHPLESLVSRYKHSYYVMRPGDRRLEGVKRDENSPPVTFGGPEKDFSCTN